MRNFKKPIWTYEGLKSRGKYKKLVIVIASVETEIIEITRKHFFTELD